MTSAIPVQRSTNWAIKPTGSWLICWVQINHPSGEKWAARISYIRFFTAVQIYEFHISKIVNIISIIIPIIKHSTNVKNDTFSIDLDGFKWQCIQHLQNCQINKTKQTCLKVELLTPLRLYISMDILHTIFFIFPELLTRRICLTI